MSDIIVFENQVKDADVKKRAAAYCRVSTDLSGQEESFDSQIQYYQNAIKQNPRWEYAGIYADKGYSGTSAKKRPEFMRLIKDAYEGKVDIILTKSISRFARNVVDCQTFTRELKNKGIEVRFEREQISNLDPAMDFIFTILAAVAQEESRSISQNVRWRYAQNYKNGIYRLGNNRILGFDMNDDGKLVPNKDAWIVKYIFKGYADGKSYKSLAKELNALNAKRLRSDKPYTADRVWLMLRNEYYVGDMLLQKNAPSDYLTKMPQTGIPYQSYYVKNSHEGIISRDIWERVQRRIMDNANKRAANPYYCEQAHFLFGMVFCGYCGTRNIRITRKSKNHYYKMWICREHRKGKKGNVCRNPPVHEEVILQKIADALGMESFCKKAFEERVKKVIVYDKEVRVILKNNYA